jgi:hypothetical protein
MVERNGLGLTGKAWSNTAVTGEGVRLSLKEACPTQETAGLGSVPACRWRHRRRGRRCEGQTSQTTD